MVYLVHHVGIGFLTIGSVVGPLEVQMSDGTWRKDYALAERVGLSTSAGDAARFPDAKTARHFAAELCKREQHDRWRALSWEAATELAA